MVSSCAVHCCSVAAPTRPDPGLAVKPINALPGYRDKTTQASTLATSTTRAAVTTRTSTTSTSAPPPPLMKSPPPVPQLYGNNVGSTTTRTSPLSHGADPKTRTRFVDEGFGTSGDNGNTLNSDRHLSSLDPVNDSLADHLNTKRQLTQGVDGKYGSPTIQLPQAAYSKAEDVREKRETVDNSHYRAPAAKAPVVRKDLSLAVESLLLVEMNSTIGREFCTTLQCVQRTGPRFSYLVPISKFMPFEYVTLQLT